MATLNQKTHAQESTPPASVHPRLEEDRIGELLDIAAEVFIAHGFEGASTTEIASRAKTSKRTFYSRFPTKEKLFIAVLERRMDFIFSQVFTELHPDSPLEETLKEYGSRIVRLALSEGQIALLRVVSMESMRFPELGERFYELGPKRGLLSLGSYMEEQIKRGRLIKEDPALMAEHFISLLTGGPVRWVVLGLQRNSIVRNGQQRLDAAVRVFMRAYSS